MSRAGFVMAGGKSSRMGKNKAFLELGGQTLLSRALAKLKQVCGNATIIGESATYGDFGPNIEDQIPGCGPLAGIHAALRHSSAQLNVMLAVDMPLVSTELLDFLATIAGQTEAVVTVPHMNLGFQPLCAVYRHGFLEVAERALRAGNYKIDATFPTIPLRIIREPELMEAGFSTQDFFNVNTHEDLHVAEGLHFKS